MIWFCFLRQASCVLFVPSFIEADIYTDISYNISLLCLDITDIGNVGKGRFLFFQFHADPVPGSFVCIVDGLIQCIAGSFTAFQIRKKALYPPDSDLRKTAG